MTRVSAHDAADRGFFLVAALLFLGSAALTLAWGVSMADMPGMEMPGGWTMSMAWMRMPGQSWPGAAASFLGMWAVMMLAMMLPALLPMLWRYRRSLGTRVAKANVLTTAAGAGYFAVWILFGVLAFPPGVWLAGAAMRTPGLARAAPLLGALVVVCAALLQLSGWKARQLECCARAGRDAVPANLASAWKHGARLGFTCLYCCAPLTALLFVAGVMDLAVMALVTVAISAERLAADRLTAGRFAPRGKRVARAIGWLMFAAGAIYLSALAIPGSASSSPNFSANHFCATAWAPSISTPFSSAEPEMCLFASNSPRASSTSSVRS